MTDDGTLLLRRDRVVEFDGDPTMVDASSLRKLPRAWQEPLRRYRDVPDVVPKTSLRFTQGQPKEYSSSPGVHRSFCGDCGSPLYYRARSGGRPSSICSMRTLSDPAALAPQFHVHSQEQSTVVRDCG